MGVSLPGTAFATTYVQYSYPFPSAVINQGFGPSHNGLDFWRPLHTPFFAVADGTVVEYGYGFKYTFDYGYWVRVSHADGKSSFYGHMDGPPIVTSGSVLRGAALGYTGNTGGTIGQTTPVQIGKHLHLGLRNSSAWEDPKAWIDSHAAPPPRKKDSMYLIKDAITGVMYVLTPNGVNYVDATLEDVIWRVLGSPSPRYTLLAASEITMLDTLMRGIVNAND